MKQDWVALTAWAVTSLVASALATLLLTSAAKAACSKAELASFVVAAQTLDKAAIPVGATLTHCPELASVAVQWQAFLLAETGFVAQSRVLDESLVVRSGREGILARARAGRYQDLLRLVDEHTPQYATAADAQLTLARVLTRKGDFARGREAYNVYLRLRPEDDEAATEALYAWIWSGNLDQAAIEFNNAGHWAATPTLAAAINRGKDLLVRLRRGDKAPGAVATGGEQELPGQLLAAYTIGQTNDVFLRRSESIDYQGLVDVHLAAHTLTDRALSLKSTSANEFAAGATVGSEKSLLVAAHCGFFTLGNDHFFGDGRVSLPLGYDLIASGGGYRTPLDTQMPLTPDGAGLMRDAVFIGLAYDKYVVWHSELQKEKDAATHEDHEVLGRLPLRETSGDELYLRLPLSYVSFPSPSPDYDTDAATLMLGAGVEAAQLFAGGWRGHATLDYDFAFVTDRAEPAHTKQVGVLFAALSLQAPLSEVWHVDIDAHFASAQDSAFLTRHQIVNSLMLGLSYGDKMVR